MPRTRPSARNASLPYPVALGEILDLPSVPVRRYDRKWLGLFAASSGGNRILSRVWKSAPRVRSVAGGRLSFLILSSSPLSRPIRVVGVLMASSRKRPLPSWKLPRGPRRHLPKRARALRLAWVLFLIVGAPLGFMAALGPMAYAGIYIEPLRQFWQPWPPHILKGIGGVLGVASTLRYPPYRKGRYTGYRTGAIAERATTRNRAEGRVPVSNPASAPGATVAAPNPPPPPEMPQMPAQ